MSKAIKSVASIALPIALSYFAPGLGTALGGSILGAGAAGSATLGGALIGGATGALTGGGLKGALLGAAGGALAPNLGDIASNTIGGTAVGDALGVSAPGAANVANVANAGTYGPIASGATPGMTAGETSFLNRAAGAANAPVTAANLGAATEGGIRSLGTQAAVSAVGNGLATINSSNAAKEAAKIQADAVDRGIATQAPYNKLGTDAAAQIAQIQADPGGYVQNNPFYKGLADDAQQRLLANEASKGKVGSGGTADALQQSLLNLGNGLVQQQIGTLQGQVNSGQTAATNTSNLQTDKGSVQAGGVVGSANALNTGYQNQISTLLALQNLNRTPSYSPSAIARV